MTFMVIDYANKTREQIEATAFEMMCRAHPHETYETWPERFLAFVRTQNPDLTKEDVERILAETAAAHPEATP
jgi:hypothetical protein